MPTVDDPLPDLIRALKSPTPDSRTRSARALGKLGATARGALPSLVQCLRDDDGPVREAAAQAVGQMGPDALPHLSAMLTHSDKYVRRNAVWAIGKFGPAAKSAGPALWQALKDPDPRTASGAAQALGNMGADAADGVPALTEAMRGTNIVLCRLAAKALSQVGRPALPALISHLKHRDPFIRGEAALALGWMGTAAAAAVPALIDALTTTGTAAPAVGVDTPPPSAPTPDETGRAYAAQALGRIGPGAAVALPALTDATADASDQVRQSVQQAIRLIRGDR